MQSKAKTVKEYLSSLPEDRRAALQVVRKVILENLDDDYEEGMQYGMIGYYVPHSVFPPGYHCDPKQPLPFGGLASQKNHMSMYFMGCYGGSELEKWFRKSWTATGRKLDMGKCCVRFKNLDDVALDVVGEMIRRQPTKGFVAHYESLMASLGSKKAKQSGSTKKSGPKKTTAKKATKSAKAARKAR
jgi:hypothetical protein